MNDKPMRVNTASATHIGRRSHNEDALFVDEDLGLMMVADGVGGHEAGEVASAITCATIAQEVAAGSNLDQSIRAANQAIMVAVEQGKGREGMAATAVAMLLDNTSFELAWVGDSRGYLWDGVHLQLLTRDHSLVETLLSRGEITLEQARTHPQKNVVVQAIGLQAESRLRVDINRGSLRPGELLILCSDGMSDVLDNPTIVDILRSAEDLHSCSETLVNTAVEQGGKDNTTVVLVQAPDDLPLAERVVPDVVWSYDARSGEVIGCDKITPPAPQPMVKKVAPKKPEATQMLSLAELERELARVQGEGVEPQEPAVSGRQWMWWALALVVAAAAVLGLGIVF